MVREQRQEGGLGGMTISGAAQAGVPAIIAEAGGRGQLEEDAVQLLVTGVRNVLRRLEMLPGEPEPPAARACAPSGASCGFARSTRAGGTRPSARATRSPRAACSDASATCGATSSSRSAPRATGVVLFGTTSPAVEAGGLLLGLGADLAAVGPPVGSPMAGSVRVFIASSLDGFIAGPNGDLSWLPAPEAGEDYGYGAFMAETAAILMGRTTYDVAAGFDSWPYGELPVFVATSRRLQPAAPSVRAVAGTASELLDAVRAETDGAVYLDGGALIRSFLGRSLIDELTVTIVNVILGGGAPLFAGVTGRHRLTLTAATPYPSGLVQLRYVATGPEPGPRSL